MPPRRQRARQQRARQERARQQRGFTLLEIVVAFSILALGLGLAMRIQIGATQQARIADEQTRAALHAQSILDVAGVGERLEEGVAEGEFEDGYSWRLEVSPYQPPAEAIDPQIDMSSMPVQLLELDLTLSWQREGRAVESHYRTLRAMQPETL